MLDERKTAILRAVVQEYVTTGQPVGSTTISREPTVNVSSATVRNDMAVLEQEGYLAQPHTSAGRIPTDKAFRDYVESVPPAPVTKVPSRAVVRSSSLPTMMWRFSPAGSAMVCPI